MNQQINRIFYTDDDLDDHLIFSIALNDMKSTATLHSFYRCDEILEYLRDENKPLPDVIFLDQNMPGNSGNECLREIKKIARLEHIPIIIYTTGGNPKLVGDAMQMGAYKYVIKPTFRHEIKNTLASLISEFQNRK